MKVFLDSVDRVASVSLDKKDGVKFNLTKDMLNLSVNNTNSGDGKETLAVNFDHDLEISFNSRYLIDVASQLDGDKLKSFNDTGSPALIKDPGDFDSIFVVMPMKGELRRFSSVYITFSKILLNSSLDSPAGIGFRIDIVIFLLLFFKPSFGQTYPVFIATG